VKSAKGMPSVAIILLISGNHPPHQWQSSSSLGVIESTRKLSNVKAYLARREIVRDQVGIRWESVGIRGNPWQSVAISGNPWQS
jgi:hypothetical protein